MQPGAPVSSSVHRFQINASGYAAVGLVDVQSKRESSLAQQNLHLYV